MTPVDPPVYAVCAADTTLLALLSDTDGRARVYPFGEAPQRTDRPYVVFQTIGGGPENLLGDLPQTDLYSLQFDIYAPTADLVGQIKRALFGVLELHGYVTDLQGDGREGTGVTKAYRYTFDFDWRLNRA